MAKDFESFLEIFLGTLAEDDFYQGQSLPAYLKRPEDERGNDEADIVDNKVVSALLEALGYSRSEVKYNRAEGGRKRTDFTVQLPSHEYPKPCAVVESKNTATKDLAAHLPQLESYLRAHGAQRGILIDGKRLIAYELAEPGPLSTTDLSLAYLVELWRGESLYAGGKQGAQAIPGAETVALRAFWQRFNRDAYTQASRLVEELTRTRAGEAHAVAGSTWRDGVAQLQIRKPDDAHFIREVRELIRDVRTDVEAQLMLRLEKYQEFKQALEHLPGSTPGSVINVGDEYGNNLKLLLSSLETAGIAVEDRNGIQFRLEGQLERLSERDLVSGLGKNILKLVNERLRLNASRAPVSKDTSKEQVLIEGAIEMRKPKNGSGRGQATLQETITAVLERMQKLLADYHARRERLLKDYKADIEVHTAFATWRDKVATLLLRGADEARLKREFAAQTSYVLIVRMLLVRIAEDKGLLERVFTNGGLALWFDQVEPRYLKYAQGKGTDYLLQMAYTSAQHIYAHFYTERLLFDWYYPERNLVIRVLHRLAGYDLREINHDVIGHVYGGYVEDEHKHESGMYYTPPEVVEYILDRLGYSGPDIIGKRLLDPASGSGTFLVSAARRLVAAYHDYYEAQGHTKIPVDAIQNILDEVKTSLYGLDLNPFACYLAETNLLIQVLDLIKRALDEGEVVTLDRFHIYNADTLKYDPKTAAVARGVLEFPVDELTVAEKIKAKRGKLRLDEHSEFDFAQGFDFIVANPPYVKADEGGEGLLEYRRALKAEHPFAEVRDVLKMKWDMFVPFVALGWHLLKDGGRMGMITSDAIEMVPYGKSLREFLVKRATVEEISFFPGVKLFEDAGVRNTTFFVKKERAEDTHETLQRWHESPPPSVIKENRLLQVANGVNVFRQTSGQLQGGEVIPLSSICFISAGMELQAHEKKFPGEFEKEDLIALEKNIQNPAPYVEASDISVYQLLRVRYLEYGPGLRAPDRVRRPRFPKLFETPKLGTPMVISSRDPQQTQVFLDEGKHHNGWLYTNHSIHLMVPWYELREVSNKSISRTLGKQDREALENKSKEFSLLYLQGVLNSKWMSEFIRAKRRDHTNLYPDDFKDIPIPNAEATLQRPIADKVGELHQLGLEFFTLRHKGWKVDNRGGIVEAAANVPDGVPTLPLASAKVRWGLRVHDDNADVTALTWRGHGLYRGRQEVLGLPETAPEEGLEWLRRQLAGLTAGTTLAMAEARGLRVPGSPVEAKRALEMQGAQESEVREKIAEFQRLRKEVDELVAALYESDGRSLGIL
jgi:type I restriction-modification system DNA methylase subunit